MNRSIDGTCVLTDKQITELAIKAYNITGLIPSRGVWGANKSCASASGAMIKAFGEFPQVTNLDWIAGFDLGFEFCEKNNFTCEEMSREFRSGFNTGRVVAFNLGLFWDSIF